MKYETIIESSFDSLSREVPFFDMLVPTMDTVRYGYLMERLLSVNRSVLFTGGTGVGKVRKMLGKLTKHWLILCRF